MDGGVVGCHGGGVNGCHGGGKMIEFKLFGVFRDRQTDICTS